MEDKDNISKEYKSLANQVYNDYVSLGSLEETAKKHKIPISLAKAMIDDATGASKPSTQQGEFSIPPDKLKEEFVKYGSLEALARRYNVGVKAIAYRFRKYGIYVSQLHREIALKKTHDDYMKLVQELGHHPRHKEIVMREGGNNLYNRIIRYYGSLGSLRRVSLRGNAAALTGHEDTPEKLKEDYLTYGSSKAVAKHYGVTALAVSLTLKRYGISTRKLHREVLLKEIEEGYLKLTQKLGHHPAPKELARYGTKHLYQKIRHYYGSLSNFRRAHGYPLSIKNKTKTQIALRARKLYQDYVSLGSLKKVAKRHKITRERVSQILKRGEALGLFKYESIRAAKRREFLSSITADKLMEDYLLHGSRSIIFMAIYYDVDIETVQEAMRNFNLSVEELHFEKGKIKTHEDYRNLMERLGYHPNVTEVLSNMKSLYHRILLYYGSFDNFRLTFDYPVPQKGYAKFTEKMRQLSEANRKNILNCISVKQGITISEIVDTLGIAKEAVRLHLIKLKEQGIIKDTFTRAIHHYCLKKQMIPSEDGKQLNLSDLKTPLSPEDRIFVDKISGLYIKFGDFHLMAKTMNMRKILFLEQLDHILESHALAPIKTRHELILSLRIKRIYDQVHNMVKTARYFGVSETVIDKYLKYGNKAGLFKRSETVYKHRDPRAVPKKEDPSSKKNIELVKAIKKEYDKSGSRKKVAQIYKLSHEKIRQILTMGNDLGLFEYPIGKRALYLRIPRERLYNDFLKYHNVAKLSKHYHVDNDEVRRAIAKHGLSPQAMKLEVRRRRALMAYQNLVEELGHHPSTTEIRKKQPYLLRFIKKIWSSISAFREAYGFPNPKMGQSL